MTEHKIQIRGRIDEKIADITLSEASSDVSAVSGYTIIIDGQQVYPPVVRQRRIAPVKRRKIRKTV